MATLQSSALVEYEAILAKADSALAKNDFGQAEQLARKVTTTRASERIAGIAHSILGSCCTFTGRPAEAAKHLEQALQYATAASDLSLQARALSATAILHRSDQYTAIPFATRALTLAEQAEDKTQQAKALNILGSLHTELSDYPRALEYYTRALARAKELEDQLTVTAYLGSIGNVYRILADYSRALDYFARALEIAEQIPSPLFIQRNLHLIGEVHSALADHERALDFLGRALTLAEQLGNKVNAANLYLSMGIVQSNLADYARALDYYDRAVKIAEETGDKFCVAACLDNIGTVYWNLLDYSRALSFFSRALAIAEEMGAKALIANNLGNTGIVYKDSGEHARALEFLERALEISTEIGDRSQIGHWMHGIASAERLSGRLEVAHRGFVETLKHRREVLRSNEGVAETLLELGGVLKEQGKLEEALRHLHEALKLAEDLGEKKFAAEAHKDIADTCARSGDVASAYEHFKKYHSIDKEVFSEESQRRIELFHIRTAVADKEREAELLRLRAERSQQDLANSTMQLLDQSELLSRFRNDAFEILRTVPTVPSAADGDVWERALRALRQKLKELPSKSIDWTKFESQFTSVHPGFKSTLIEKYPHLTKQELKMCQLARLGISTAEMARLLCLSERTIDSHRLNLRKKVGLSNAQNLTKFLIDLK